MVIKSEERSKVPKKKGGPLGRRMSLNLAKTWCGACYNCTAFLSKHKVSGWAAFMPGVPWKSVELYPL